MDVGTAGVGPWAATLLGLLGADVLKIESPAGDRHLYQPPLQKGLSTTYTSLNLNKRAAIVDLKDPEAWPAVERMVRQADVIMDNLRPGVVDRMGVGFEAAQRINPRIISASSPAWGEQGPLRDLPALDPQVQMFSGFASLNGARGGKREMLRYPHLDFNASCYFASTVLLALLARERTGQAQRVVSNHMGNAVTLQTSNLAEYFTTGKVPEPMGSGCTATVPHQYFRCRDDRYLAVGVETAEQWRSLCRAIRREELAEDPSFASNRDRVKHREELIPRLEEVFASHPARWWALRLEEERVPFAFLMDFDQLRYHSQIQANGFITEINPAHPGRLYIGQVPWLFSQTPGGVRIGGVAQGEHTREILDNGFGDGVGPTTAGPNGKDDASAPPLSGYRVVDATQGYAGPFAGLLLAEAGADVIKVEPPGGDYARNFAHSGPDGDSSLFMALNRNKRSIMLDLAKEDDRRQYHALVRTADILIEDWGPGIAEERGLDYADLSAAHPELLYCALSAYGEKGPLRDWPGSELVFQAWSEYWKNLGSVGEAPQRVGADIVGLGTGVMAFLGILAGLYRRIRTGQGQRMSLSMLSTMMFLRTAQWAAVTSPDGWDGDTYCNNQVSGPRYGYMTKDRPIFFNLNNATEEQWSAILQDFGMHGEVADDPRFGNGGRDAVGLGKYSADAWSIWEKHFQKYPCHEVLDILNRHGASATEMLYLDGLLEHPQMQALNLVARDAEGRQYLRAPWVGPWESVAVRSAPSLDQDGEEVAQLLSV